MAIDRDEINQAIYFGLGLPSNNTVLPLSPLYKPEYSTTWATTDIDQANQLLDEMGLSKRGDDNIRLLPDGQPMIIIIDTAGESTEETDVLQLVRDSWKKIGVDLFTKPSELEVFRNRIFAGESIMSVWTGMDNGFPSADMSPWEFTPTSQQQFQWAKWGQFLETTGESGEKVDMPEAQQLFDLMNQWRAAARYRQPHQDLGADPGDLDRPGLHHRHRRQRAAAGGGEPPPAQRAGEGDLVVGPGRAVRRLQAGHLLAGRAAALEHSRRADNIRSACSAISSNACW